MHLKSNTFVRKLIRIKHSIKFAVIFLCEHVCMQFHTWQTENNIRFAYISVHANRSK